VELGSALGEVEIRYDGIFQRTAGPLSPADEPFGMIATVHEHYMRLALAEAQAALDELEVPVGAVIVQDDRLIASAHNQREQLRDPTAHAEMIAITQAAGALGSWRLDRCTLYVTLEPCPMCAGAILQARLPIVVYGAADPKAGAVHTLYQLLSDPRLNHRPQIVSGVLAGEGGAILTRFFQNQRRLGKK
jgi:tRNA(adenine34) deaminase